MNIDKPLKVLSVIILVALVTACKRTAFELAQIRDETPEKGDYSLIHEQHEPVVYEFEPSLNRPGVDEKEDNVDWAKNEPGSSSPLAVKTDS